MAQAEDVRRLKEQLGGHPGPMLSVYLSVNARYEENQGQAYKVRLKDALDEMEVPEELAGRVREEVEEEVHPGARTVIFFVTEDGLFERYNLQLDLPESYHFGEPYLAPLVLAFDEHEPYGIALLDAQEFRFFVSAPIEEPGQASKGASSGFFREVDIESRQPYPKVGGTTDHDPAGYTRQAHLHRFFKELAEVTHKLVLRNGVKHLILAGPKERTAEFRDTLPQDIQERVVADEQVEARGPENKVLEEFEDMVERAERERKAGLIEQARESGVQGVKDTIEALQLGQVHHLLALWDLEGEIRWCDNDEFAITDISARECPFCSQETRVRPLMDVLVDLAAARNARLEFVRAENEVFAEHPNEATRDEYARRQPADVLREEFEGLVGLLRFTLTEQPSE
ncbi:MAG TPA: VLRF1 family aeRF1-type release factor, partial [Rubrobacteraceae bacterium]|nr:VLRF1 family aeRF1-type release factor [Rubrobacteraceae bacterium]